MDSRNRFFIALLAVIGVVFILGASNGARAQNGDSSTDADGATDATASSEDEIDASIKGMVGMGLIGAELGFVIPAVAGLHETWAFIVFPIVGAAGGAVGGYFLLEDGSPEASVAVLAVGMALVIPAMVITLSSTAYDPEDEPTVVTVEEAALQRPQARKRSVSEMARRAGPGLLRWSDDGVFLAAPAVEPVLHPSAKEARRLGLKPTAELRVPLLSGSF